jgi:hypothetical protein
MNTTRQGQLLTGRTMTHLESQPALFSDVGQGFSPANQAGFSCDESVPVMMMSRGAVSRINLEVEECDHS